MTQPPVAGPDRVPAVLPDALIERIRERAPGYDATNTFFEEDLAELVEAGYLRAFVPEQFGGLGLSLEEMTRAQERLAGAAPSTALAVNMHHVWVGVARVVHASGDDSLDWLLRAAAEGEIFAFGVSERGNDLVLFGSTSQAEPAGDGGYRFTGTKIFTSLSPGWTMLGTFGLDSTSPDSPKNVYGFVRREDPGVTIKDDWDTLGMRASQSCTTVLDGARARPEHVARRLDPGPNPDPFIFGIFATFEILLAAVYTGIARRALDLAVQTVKSRTSLARGGAPYATDPDIRWRLASAAIALDGIHPQIAGLARDIDGGPGALEHGPLWFPRLSGVKSRATEVAKDVVDAAIRVSGGSSYFTRSELSRLYRDVLAGLFHPSDDESVHGAWARALLGPLP